MLQSIALSLLLASLPTGELFERVVQVLAEGLYGGPSTRQAVLENARQLRPTLGLKLSSAGERQAIQSLLERLELSHLALYSEVAYASMSAELAERSQPTFGLQLVEWNGAYFADWIYEGGPAERAGIRRGEQVLEIAGEAVASSALLDWRSDDAALPDPAQHAILCQGVDDLLSLRLRDAAGGERDVTVRAMAYSGARAARASVRIQEVDGWRFGYVHLWFISVSTPTDLVRELLSGEFRDCDALVLDLRGRGGLAHEVERLLACFEGEQGLWSKPVIALTNSCTRSAKEVLAYRLRASGSAMLVGEHTAGAVIPASFAKLGNGAVLMFPRSSLGQMTELIEGQGVAPDVLVAAPLPHADGKDPILDAGWVAARVWCEALATSR